MMRIMKHILRLVFSLLTIKILIFEYTAYSEILYYFILYAIHKYL